MDKPRVRNPVITFAVELLSIVTVGYISIISVDEQKARQAESLST